MSKFGDSLRALSEQVGERELTGTVTFSGPHAVPQHEFSSRFNPPSWAGKTALQYTTGGTGPRYLSGPLMTDHPRYLQQIADDLYREGRGPRRAMRDAMDDLKDAAQRRVPRETGDLAESARVHVTDDGSEWIG